MDDLVFISKVQRIIKMRHDDVVAAMVSGGVDNMEKYQYMLGQIRNISVSESGSIHPARKKGAKRRWRKNCQYQRKHQKSTYPLRV